MSSKGFDDYDYYGWDVCAPSMTCKSNFQMPEMPHQLTIQCPPTRQVASPIHQNFPFTTDPSMIEHTIQTCLDEGCTWPGSDPFLGWAYKQKFWGPSKVHAQLCLILVHQANHSQTDPEKRFHLTYCSGLEDNMIEGRFGLSKEAKHNANSC